MNKLINVISKKLASSDFFFFRHDVMDGGVAADATSDSGCFFEDSIGYSNNWYKNIKRVEMLSIKGYSLQLRQVTKGSKLQVQMFQKWRCKPASL